MKQDDWRFSRRAERTHAPYMNLSKWLSMYELPDDRVRLECQGRTAGFGLGTGEKAQTDCNYLSTRPTARKGRASRHADLPIALSSAVKILRWQAP